MKKVETLCRRRRSLISTHCRLCNKSIKFLAFFYKVPWYETLYLLYFEFKIDYENFFSDHHCENCHNERIEKLGHCPKCDAHTEKKETRKGNLIICPR